MPVAWSGSLKVPVAVAWTVTMASMLGWRSATNEPRLGQLNLAPVSLPRNAAVPSLGVIRKLEIT